MKNNKEIKALESEEEKVISGGRRLTPEMIKKDESIRQEIMKMPLLAYGGPSMIPTLEYGGPSIRPIIPVIKPKPEKELIPNEPTNKETSDK